MSVFGTILFYVSANLLGCYFGWLTIFRTRTTASRTYRKYGFNFFLSKRLPKSPLSTTGLVERYA